MNKKRKNMMAFRLSDGELKQLNDMFESSELTHQEFLRQAVLKSKVIQKSHREELIKELRAEGNNLNQIAHNINAGRFNFQSEMLEKTIKKLETLWQSLKQ